jgi:hypothetical protein
VSDRDVSTADLLGLALEPLFRGGVCMCVHEAVADQMIADGWGDRPLQARINEHLAYCHAIMNRKVKCPAWDTCAARIETEKRMVKRDKARWGDTFWPHRLSRGLTDQFRFSHKLL